MTEQKPFKMFQCRISDESARKIKIIAAIDEVPIQEIGQIALTEYIAKREEREPLPARQA